MKGHCPIPIEARRRGGRNQPRPNCPIEHYQRNGRITGAKNFTVGDRMKGGHISQHVRKNRVNPLCLWCWVGRE